MAEDVGRRSPLTPLPNSLGPLGLRVEVRPSSGSLVVRPDGELDMASAPLLEAALTTAMDGSPAAIAVDLSDLTFLDSTGVRVLLTAGRRAGREDRSFVLRSPRPPVLKVLRLTGIERLVSIEDHGV